jgi:hypothetical protein
MGLKCHLSSGGAPGIPEMALRHDIWGSNAISARAARRGHAVTGRGTLQTAVLLEPSVDRARLGADEYNARRADGTQTHGDRDIANSGRPYL